MNKTTFVPVKAHVCPYTEKYCHNCRYFDPNFKEGYCDKKGIEVSMDTSAKSCTSWYWNKQ